MKFFSIFLTAFFLLTHAFAEPYSLASGSIFLKDLSGKSCPEISSKIEKICPQCGLGLVNLKAIDRLTLLNDKEMNICFYLQNGVEILDFAGPMEVFSYAGFHVFTVSKTKGPIVTQGILSITPDYSIDDAPPAEILAFFGGNSHEAANDPAVIAWIKSRKSSTKYFFSVCTGAFIIGRAGILDSLTATTFHSSIEDLRGEFPSTKVLSDVRFVDNGTVITTAGISAGIDGALHLVAKLKGDLAAKEVARHMEYDKWVPGQGLDLSGK
jgi:transcriptional regulator GlxA family with amidase domain